MHPLQMVCRPLTAPGLRSAQLYADLSDGARTMVGYSPEAGILFHIRRRLVVDHPLAAWAVQHRIAF